jgi:plasmid stabilization system protein ParE
MKIIITNQSLQSLEDSIDFMQQELELPFEKVTEISDRIFSEIEKLEKQPYLGQVEPLLQKSELQHRRLIIKHHKIIYRIEAKIIYITDIFDSRQDPYKMKSK